MLLSFRHHFPQLESEENISVVTSFWGIWAALFHFLGIQIILKYISKSPWVSMLFVAAGQLCAVESCYGIPRCRAAAPNYFWWE